MTLLNAFYAQSGGVTSVINASACGVIETARRHPDRIGNVYAGRNGIIGALTEDLIDTSAGIGRGDRRAARHARGRLRLLPLQAQVAREEPARVRAADRGLQGARHRLLLLQRRRRFGRHLLQGEPAVAIARLSAGRPSTCPRPIDNDLPLTDCCPGFGSVAKYVAVSTLEASLDVRSMAATSTKVFVLEVMGRHAGWIAAAGGLAADHGIPVVILFPEIPFDQPAFLARVDALVKHHGYCTVVVSEGCAPSRRHLPRRAGHQGRLRPCAARRRGAGGGADGQGSAGPQVPLGGGRLPAALGAPHRVGDRRAAGLRARAARRRARAGRPATR